MILHRKKNLKPWKFTFDEENEMWIYKTNKGTVYRIFFDECGIWIGRLIQDGKDGGRWVWVTWENELRAESLEMDRGTFFFKK